MPELPEVETTRRGIEPFLLDKQIQSVLVHKRSLRWPIPKAIEQLSTSPILHVGRRGKYILLANSHGTAIIHLGMSGSLRIDKQNSPRRKHDHVELFLNHKLEVQHKKSEQRTAFRAVLPECCPLIAKNLFFARTYHHLT